MYIKPKQGINSALNEHLPFKTSSQGDLHNDSNKNYK